MWKRQVLAGLHAVQISNKKSPANQNLPHIMFKTRFPFLYASTSLDTKTLIIASNRNFESCMSIRCLAPQPGSRFFHFCRGFPLPLATLLIIVSSSSTLFERSRYKKRCQQWVTFSGNLDPSSLTPGAPVVLLVWGFKRRRDNLLAWRELFANLYELKSCIRFWEEYNHFEFIGYLDLTDFCQISPKHSGNNDKRKCVGKFWYLKFCLVTSIYATPRIFLATPTSDTDI